MTQNPNPAVQIAKYLLDIQAVTLNVENPYTWSSGLRSPIYCDNRKTLSYVEVRRFIVDAFAKHIQTNAPETQCIAGVATGAIAVGYGVAEKLSLPMVYVRSSAKAHGLGNLVEGVLPSPKAKTFVVEDLVSTGGSSFQAVEALRNAGADVLGLVSIFTYQFPKAVNLFVQNQVPYSALCTLDDLLKVAVQRGDITEANLQFIQQWRQNPEAWSQQFA